MVWACHNLGCSSVVSYYTDRAVNVGFVMDKVAVQQGFLKVVRFPLPVSFHHCTVFILQFSTTDTIKS